MERARGMRMRDEGKDEKDKENRIWWEDEEYDKVDENKDDDED